MMTNLTKNEICSLFEGTKAWFDKSLQWTVTADVRLLLECFRLELKADFDKLLLQLGAGSLFKQRPGEFMGIATNLWRIWGGWSYGGFVEELRRIYRKRSNHEMRADLTLAAARQSRENYLLAGFVNFVVCWKICRFFMKKTSPLKRFIYSSEQQTITILKAFQKYNQKAPFHRIYALFS